MWKLTVTREYTTGTEERKWTAEDRMYFESKSLGHLQRMIEYFDDFGTEGKYAYKIVRKESEEDVTV